MDAAVTMANSSMSATAATMSSGPDAASQESAFGLLAKLILAALTLVPSVFYWTIKFASITLPTFLFGLFSVSLTFTLNFTTIAMIAFFFVSTITWFLRYRYFNMYSRLPPEPQRSQPQVDVFPDSADRDSKPGLSNYLDEFLSAIKVFGYLERPVFHELTRTMQTKKLLAGETLLLEEEKGFCLVVDGEVQIFVKSKRDEESKTGYGETTPDEDDDRDSHNQGYQLLTE
ncbi:phosphatidylcholine and lysophosphatidylcholine phospholipase, partial [Coniosporium uncinatum]